jgi:signal transduction histidine kinase
MDTKNTLTPEVLVPKIGDHLVKKGLISNAQLDEALNYQKDLRITEQEVPLLGQILVQMGFIDKELLDQSVTEQILQLRSALEKSNEQLRDANRDLESRVKARTAELRKALDKLSELSKLKANFLANISHELRTPMTHLKGYIELLNTGDLGPLNDQQQHAIKTMLRASDRLGNLIEDLILFSVSEQGPINLIVQPINLLSLCRSIAARTQPRAEERDIIFVYSAPEKVPYVDADRDKIAWVIAQLLDNALKFTQSGGEIKLSLSEQKDEVIVTVTDTGIGIPKERIDEIFEPFHQLDGSSTRRYGGTGMGLSLALKLVQVHESQLEVTSSPEKGSQFQFALKKTKAL